jgi:urease accessory protein
MRVVLDNGEEAALRLKRGRVLHDGELLHSTDGRVVRICAAPEPVSTVYSDDSLLLARVAYHLGNRHVALQIEKNRLRYLADHVLDQLVTHLGLQVVSENVPFQPESGAYAMHTHRHD